MFLVVHVPIAHEQSLALHHHFHLFEVVADESRARANDVEDAISKTDARTNLYATCDDMDIGFDAVFVHKLAQDVRIAGGYLAVVEPLKASIVCLLRDSKRQATFAETEMRYNLCIFATLHKFVFANYADVGNSVGYALRNIIVAKIKHFEWEVGTLHQ